MKAIITELSLKQIDPSPYQLRQTFDIESLAAQLRANGLIHPILCRPRGQRYELVAGERRWRAAELVGWKRIDAYVKQLSDLQAEDMCLSENIQRQDLSEVETIEAIARMVDVRMRADDDYLPWLAEQFDSRGGRAHELSLESPVDRTALFLALADDDRRSGSGRVSHKFMEELEKVFANLGRPVQWRSYCSNDLPIIRDLPEPVRSVAITQRLNKQQTSALTKAHRQAPEKTATILSTGAATKRNPETMQEEAVPLRELPAREISALAQVQTPAPPKAADPVRVTLEAINGQIADARRMMRKAITDGLRAITGAGRSPREFIQRNGYAVYEHALDANARARVLKRLEEMHGCLEEYAGADYSLDEIKHLARHTDINHIVHAACDSCFGYAVADVYIDRMLRIQARPGNVRTKS